MELYSRCTAPKRSDTWLVYALVDSRSPAEIRYIGITNDPRRRLRHHCSPLIEQHTRKSRWIAKTIRDGGDVLLRVMAKGLTHDSAKVTEVALICANRGQVLTNLTDGGDGTSGRLYSAETREKIAATRRGKPLSDDVRAKLSAANTGKMSPNKGRVLTSEWRANISAGGIRRMQDPAVRKHISAQNIARYANDDARRLTAIATRLAGPPTNNKSGFKGVSFCGRTKKWVAQIKTDKRKHIGRFPTPEDAARAYDAEAYAAWGRDCYLNFPAGIAA